MRPDKISAERGLGLVPPIWRPAAVVSKALESSKSLRRRAPDSCNICGMRQYGYARTSDRLGRYYTNSAISQCLIDLIDDAAPSAVVDLGSGQGALSVAASSRWRNAALATVDVDDVAANVLVGRLRESGFSGGHFHVAADALSVDLPGRIHDAIGSAPNLAVCNPPFFVPVWQRDFLSIAEDAGLSECLPPPANTDAACLFLAQNLRLVSDGGTVAIIVPDSLASASKYQSLRQSLMRRFDLQHSIKLPAMSFSGTEARAHIMIVKKSSMTSETVRLSSLNSLTGAIQSVDVSLAAACERLDIDFHRQRMGPGNGLTLGDIAIDVRRGSFSSAQVRNSPGLILHTTDIVESMRGQWIDLSSETNSISFESGTWVEPGDLIVARVGRNASSKVVGVSSGRMPISDCLFRIRVPKVRRRELLKMLSSVEGRMWLEANSHGVAARHISKLGLLNFPLER